MIFAIREWCNASFSLLKKKIIVIGDVLFFKGEYTLLENG